MISWEMEAALGVGFFVLVFGAALGLLRPSDNSPDTVRRFRYLAVGLAALFALEFGVRLIEGQETSEAFVCASNPKAALHHSRCEDGGFP